MHPDEASALEWDDQAVKRYDLSGPRYTSYPTAPQFSADFSQLEWYSAVERSNRSGAPLSLYVHIPFCETLCYYCACNKIVTNNKGRAQPYLGRVAKEMALYASLFDRDRPVKQLHWGGGTPTYISTGEMTWLMSETRRYFKLLDNDRGEYSVEVHPGRVSADTLAHLRDLGFNRVSMGVQDFNPRVQRAINRYNSVEQVRQLMQAVRRQGYLSISMDLIYGLPLQTRSSMAETLEQVIELEPDRLSLFNYAHLPQRFKSQRLIDESQLPDAGEKLAILQMAIERLQAAGYVYIGMDHFARPGDSLVTAQRQGKLQRNFQGYSTHGNCDLIACGVSAISYYGGAYLQNAKNLEQYQSLIDAGGAALTRGVQLTREDQLRRDVISELICHFYLDFESINRRHLIDVKKHFAVELDRLKPLQDDGLVTVTENKIIVNNSGRLLIRNICMAFDQYLARDNLIAYSKVI